jgi:predicted glycoside hydrolase/deacetylase ChbG (UPF0249 family)
VHTTPTESSTRGQRVRVIVNADDLGADSETNEAIFTALSDGVISSATIMATGAAAEDACRRVRGGEFPAASFGVHLNVTDHEPLTRNPDLRDLLDEAGHFRRDGIYETRWSRSLENAIADEWIAQVRRIRDGGVSVSHLDSHHHTHTLPALFFALKRVQRATGVRRVRGTWSIYDRAHMPPPVLRAKKAAWSWALRNVHRTTTTSGFADFLMFLRAVDEGSFAPRRWPQVIELMVHPGPSAESDEAPRLRTNWLAELPVRASMIDYRSL